MAFRKEADCGDIGSTRKGDMPKCTQHVVDMEKYSLPIQHRERRKSMERRGLDD